MSKRIVSGGEGDSESLSASYLTMAKEWGRCQEAHTTAPGDQQQETKESKNNGTTLVSSA